MAKELSQRQQQIVEFISHYMDEEGIPPTVRDIVRGCGLSSTSVADYNLRILEREGQLRRRPDISRGIEMPGWGRGVTRVPLLGAIAAGAPIPVPDTDTWQSAPLETVEVPAEMVGRAQGVYALRVKGTSMIDALIDDGDVVLLTLTRTVNNGEMAAVWLKSEKEATLKRFYQEKRRIRLQPANSALSPMWVSPQNVEVQGKVVAVLRRVG
ncbi:MAG: transcriptional repressor LexA [Dehalococcoidia bacterium]|jgi:repressor LexA|nr:transcriptional repressor LexA [Dehalococcoidia bacterium]MDP6510490.1 transcriptional repressor LexA [Dehalococcoidia bacterium]MDP6782916.1 transcriptional repressor LexA [Dehalococcoidia bacterium]